MECMSESSGKLKEIVVIHIRKQIFEERTLCGGDRISERELSRILGMSRAPIREALKELEEQGLIVSEKYRGWFVADFREEEFFEINQIRSLLEYNLLETLLQRNALKKEDLDHAQRLNDDLRSIVFSDIPSNKKSRECAEKEIFFHSFIDNLGTDHCFWTRKLLKNLTYQTQSALYQWQPQEKQMKAAVESHDRLIQCLRKGDVEKLRTILFKRLEIGPGAMRGNSYSQSDICEILFKEDTK
ncbi:MAG: GntR family transcriptional regulator [Synergistaceae bacterium]|nr:GntR family transcriptional regulator [Synergistaceae bacterium]